MNFLNKAVDKISHLKCIRAGNPFPGVHARADTKSLFTFDFGCFAQIKSWTMKLKVFLTISKSFFDFSSITPFPCVVECDAYGGDKLSKLKFR